MPLRLHRAHHAVIQEVHRRVRPHTPGNTLWRAALHSPRRGRGTLAPLKFGNPLLSNVLTFFVHVQLCAVRAAAEERHEQVRAAAAAADGDAAAAIAQLDAEDDTAAEQLLHSTKPSEDAVMSNLCRRSASVRHAVALHKDSVQVCTRRC